ncbi:sensor histidine kinase [Mesobacillus zeae]|uniref:histidine kinase n=1 Tax=Mesobacillus zeae TaxID=1917180 RepID=A0A398B8P2_9BACI|nr:sensor histidine kinase [Mesobacillus zeae]RID85861.1 sensor histidine kinase [Mesobacillus zeae]
MKNKLSLFKKNYGSSPYFWAVLSILPFYFIFQSSSTFEMIVGLLLTILFFITYRFAFISKKWTVYLWSFMLIGISVGSVFLFNYVYFSFYIAYYIGNIKNRIAFFTIYFAHLLATTVAVNYKFVVQEEIFLEQLPFIIIIGISMILLPFSIRGRNERGQLEEKLENANKRLEDLVKLEERQRIARDLHDTLGQKLSLIGLKSDLARRLITKDPEQAKSELMDVQQTARTALKEVRKMVSEMRGIRLREEIVQIRQILQAAEIEAVLQEDEFVLQNVPLLTENILSMCLKEAVTNVVKHSGATKCLVSVVQDSNKVTIIVQDNGKNAVTERDFSRGNGLEGMRERLEFVNGSLEIRCEDGIKLIISVPTIARQEEKEDLN